MNDLNQAILAARPNRNTVDVWQPYAFFIEPEHSANRRVEDVATIFLTNRECPFHCLMCDLWKNTTEETVPLGAIPAQIDFALNQMGPARHLKLYNSGNFFDARAIPTADHAAIADRCRGFESVIVENHPQLCGPHVLRFRDLLAERNVQLEVAMGLETIHPEVLPRLNKQMTTDDFAKAAKFLTSEGIRTRAFILLRPPFMTEAEGVTWAHRSIEFAFDCGVDCCAVIPTRGGNGIMEQLAIDGSYAPPALASLEEVLEDGLKLSRGRVFVDLWDARKFSKCSQCVEARVARLQRMNLIQQPEAGIVCDACVA